MGIVGVFLWRLNQMGTCANTVAAEKKFAQVERNGVVVDREDQWGRRDTLYWEYEGEKGAVDGEGTSS